MSKHDDKIKQLANNYKNDGWTVWAQIPDWDAPKFEHMGRTPDLFVKKEGEVSRIIEVETTELVDGLHAKIRKNVFSAFASRFHYRFDLVTV